MIVDTSAIVAIYRQEPGWEELSHALLNNANNKVSAATLVEIYAVLDDRARPENRRRLDALLRAYQIVVVPFTGEQAELARGAYRDFGRGSGHPARLNLGDCFSYALASLSGEVLLFVGQDFKHTDLGYGDLPPRT